MKFYKLCLLNQSIFTAASLLSTTLISVACCFVLQLSWGIMAVISIRKESSV